MAFMANTTTAQHKGCPFADLRRRLGAGKQMVPQEELRLRSQGLMGEIGRGSGALDRTEEEHQSLQKLLDRFEFNRSFFDILKF